MHMIYTYIYIFTYLYNYIFLNMFESVYLDVFLFICILLYMWLCSACSNASPVVWFVSWPGLPVRSNTKPGVRVLFWWPISHMLHGVGIFIVPTKLGDLCWANVGKYSSTMGHMGILYLYCVQCTGRFDVLYIYVWVLSQPPQPSDPHNNGWNSPLIRPHIIGEGQPRGFPLYHTISSLQHIPIIPDFSAKNVGEVTIDDHVSSVG